MKRSKPACNGTKHKTRAADERAQNNPQRGENSYRSTKPPTPAVPRESREPYRPSEAAQLFTERKRLFLAVGDEVSHLHKEHWGIGVVMETMTSSVPGGTCLARIRFQDGQLRCFNNDLDNESCCYYFGVRRYWNPTHGVEVPRSKFLALKG